MRPNKAYLDSSRKLILAGDEVTSGGSLQSYLRPLWVEPRGLRAMMKRCAQGADRCQRPRGANLVTGLALRRSGPGRHHAGVLEEAVG